MRLIEKDWRNERGKRNNKKKATLFGKPEKKKRAAKNQSDRYRCEN